MRVASVTLQKTDRIRRDRVRKNLPHEGRHDSELVMGGGDVQTFYGTGESLRQALHETLDQLKSDDNIIRVQAEQKAKALEVTDDYAVYLCDVILDTNAEFGRRQLSCVMLWQYVEQHWSGSSEAYVPPECPAATKEKVRRMLLLGLQEPRNKLRSTIAYGISAIAQHDWPEKWPELFEVLMQALKSNDVNVVDGVMRVLSEFSRDVADTQMVHMAPVILPELFTLLQGASSSLRIRCQAIKIFTCCALVLITVSHQDKSILTSHLGPALSTFMQPFISILKEPQGQGFHPTLKIEVLKALKDIAKCDCRYVQPYLSEILGLVWSTLTDTAEMYVANHVNNTEELAADDLEADGEVYDIYTLVQAILEFVQILVESPKLKAPVRKGLEELIFYLIIYIQVTDEKLQAWAVDPEKFARDEDDDTFAYGVRISALETLSIMHNEFEDDCALPACAAVWRQLASAQASRASGDPNWWKLHEASTTCLAAFSDLLSTKFHANQLPLQFDLQWLLQKLAIEDINLPGASPYFVGRCLYFASKFVSCMQQPLIQSYLGILATALQSAQPAILRMCAVRALHDFCSYLGRRNGVDLLRPYLGSFVEALYTIATEASSSALCVILEAFGSILSLDAEFTAAVESKVTPLAMNVFLKHSNDIELVGLSQDILKELSRVPACGVHLQQKLVPTFVQLLTAPTNNVPSGIQAVAIDVLATLVLYSTPSGSLSECLIGQAFPVCVEYILNTDDITCMQSGGECLRAYVYAGYTQLAAWRNEKGQSGLHLVLHVCEHLLDPKAPESAAAFIGRLVSTLLTRAAGDLGQEAVELLLRAVLSKLLHTETCMVQQTLIVVFARLVHSDLGALLDFLSSVPGPSGESALAFVLTEWCGKQQLFHGRYDIKVTILALAKLVEHALTTNDERLLKIVVKGDEIFDLGTDGGPRTRAQRAKKPIRWTEIPVVVKMYKLILMELFGQSERAWEDNDDDTESENEDEDRSDSKQAISGVDAPSFVEYGSTEEEECDDEDDDDPEIRSDPLNTIELGDYLKVFIENIIQLPYYPNFSQHHTPLEKTALASMGFTL